MVPALGLMTGVVVVARFVVVVVVVVAVLLPVTVGAQTTTTTTTTLPPASQVAGTGDACAATPAAWRPLPADSDWSTASECTLVVPACPLSPLGGLMGLSAPSATVQTLLGAGVAVWPSVAGLAAYREFCEDRITEAVDAAAYATCAAATGVVVELYDDGGPACRVLAPMTCPAGLRRGGAETCSGVVRRGWSCPTGYTAANTFGSCWQQATTPAQHPACGPGAPTFVVVDCERYVGVDYLTAPAAVACATYGSGLTANPSAGVSAGHWCAYDASGLSAQCHRSDITAPGCGRSVALCVKRASGTGGCAATAETIRCRTLEAGRIMGTLTADEVRQGNCVPCLRLPFSPAPAHCDTTPTAGSRMPSHLDRVLSVRDDFAIGATRCDTVTTPAQLAANTRCRALAVCADPPQGHLEWDSTHASGLAVINSPVRLEIVGVPLTDSPGSHISYHRVLGRLGFPPLIEVLDQTPVWTDADPAGDPRHRTMNEPDPTTAYATVADIIDVECYIEHPPLHNIVATELLPSDGADHARIETLFGAGTLDWFDNLTAAQQQQRSATAATVVEIVCDDRACEWTPTRPGYYQLVAVSAWQQKLVPGRAWGILHDATFHDELLDYLAIAANRADLATLLAQVGLTAGDIGLAADLTGPLPAVSDDSQLHTSTAPTRAGCYPYDVRVTCGTESAGILSYDTGNYTETEPVPVVVHEIRVSTVTPTR